MRTPVWRPPTDVYELEETLVVRVEIAGMREEDFIIQLNGRILSIRGRGRMYPSDVLITRWRFASASSASTWSCRFTLTRNRCRPRIATAFCACNYRRRAHDRYPLRGERATIEDDLCQLPVGILVFWKCSTGLPRNNRPWRRLTSQPIIPYIIQSESDEAS